MYDFESTMNEEERENFTSLIAKMPFQATLNEFLNLIDKVYMQHTAIIE